MLIIPLFFWSREGQKSERTLKAWWIPACRKPLWTCYLSETQISEIRISETSAIGDNPTISLPYADYFTKFIQDYLSRTLYSVESFHWMIAKTNALMTFSNHSHLRKPSEWRRVVTVGSALCQFGTQCSLNLREMSLDGDDQLALGEQWSRVVAVHGIGTVFLCKLGLNFGEVFTHCLRSLL